jgi:hypothetical protein
MKRITPKNQSGASVEKTITNERTPRKKSAQNITFLRDKRSVKTPASKEKETDEASLAARIKPNVPAFPPASRTAIAKATGNAAAARFTNKPESQRVRKSG